MTNNTVYTNDGAYGAYRTGQIGSIMQGQAGVVVLFTLYDLNGNAVDLTGYTITGKLRQKETQTIAALVGATVVTGNADDGEFSWTTDEDDIGESGDYAIWFRATKASSPTYITFPVPLSIVQDEDVSGTFSANLVGVTVSQANWLAASVTAMEAGAEDHLVTIDGSGHLQDGGAAITDLVAVAGDTMTGALQFSGTTHVGIVVLSLTTAQRDAIGSPATGALIWNSTDEEVQTYNGSDWVSIAGGHSHDAAYVNITGDTMTGALQFSGTTHVGLAVISLTTAQRNAIGAPTTGALIWNSTDTELQTYNGSAWVSVAGGHNHDSDYLQVSNNLSDLDDAATARTNLDVDQAGTDNSTPVTLAGSLDYLTLSGQQITRNAIDLTADVTGDLPVADGGTGASDAATARTNLGIGTGDSPQFAGINVGHASDTTITRTGAGDIAVEGSAVYRAGGTDVPLTDGGTGASDAATARTNLGLVAGGAGDIWVEKAGDAMSGSLTFSGTTHVGIVVVSLTTAQRDAIGSPATGALIWNSSDAELQTYNGAAWIGLSPDTHNHDSSYLQIANNLSDLDDAATARTNLDVDQAGTDNSTPVTLAGSLDYLTLSGQQITRNAIDLTTDVTGDLPVTEGGTGASDAATARTNLGVGTGDSPQFAGINVGHASDTTITRTGVGDIAVEGNAIYRAGGTDVAIADGGTGASTAATARTNLGVGTGDSPQFAGINVGNASDTTITRVSAGNIAVEGNAIYRAGGTDVPVTDGGTGASDAATARTNLGLVAGGAGDIWVEKAGDTMSGELNMADNLLTRPKIKDYGESVNAIGSIGGGNQDIDLTLGNVVTGTVDTSTTTFAFSNPPASGTAGSFTLILTNGGSQTVNWPAAVQWAGGTVPTLTPSGVDVLTFVTVDGGTTWYGFAAGLNMS